MDFLQECTRRRESQFHGVVVYKHFSGGCYTLAIFPLESDDFSSWSPMYG